MEQELTQEQQVLLKALEQAGFTVLNAEVYCIECRG